MPFLDSFSDNKYVLNVVFKDIIFILKYNFIYYIIHFSYIIIIQYIFNT